MKAIKEAYRVLPPEGLLFIWTSIRDYDDQYKAWEAQPKPAQYDKYHMWAFLEEDILKLTNQFVLQDAIKVRKNELIYIFQK